MVILRILFTILSALCVAAVFPIGFLAGLEWALCAVVAAVIFFTIMLFIKAKQEKRDNPPEEHPDFFQPKEKEEKGE